MQFKSLNRRPIRPRLNAAARE